jgi:hypothetical protein
MAKRNNVDMAINEQMLGGMGITGEYSIMRHMMNLESVITYDIHFIDYRNGYYRFLHLNSIIFDRFVFIKPEL